MDFITDLSPSKKFDAIYVVVNQLIKMAHFVPCKKTTTKEETTRFFLDSVHQYYRLLDDNISDRGS